MGQHPRQKDLEAALLKLYSAWASLPIQPGFSRPYYAERFRQMVVPGCKNYIGGIRAVQHVLTKRTLGLKRLKNHPELTVEALIAKGDWDDIIDEPFQTVARTRYAAM